jgi:hypothetical protein
MRSNTLQQAELEPPACGTRKSYQGTRKIAGCRCDECSRANAAYQQAYRAGYPQYYQKWMLSDRPTLARMIELTEFDDTYGGLL